MRQLTYRIRSVEMHIRLLMHTMRSAETNIRLLVHTTRSAGLQYCSEVRATIRTIPQVAQSLVRTSSAAHAEMRSNFVRTKNIRLVI